MEDMANLINRIAIFLAGGIGAASVIAFIWAGAQYMFGSGEPQKMQQARNTLFGAGAGLIIAGAAFVVPRMVSQAIIEPTGGVAIVTEGQVSCDDLLQQQLVAQRGANNANRMNEVIRLIQGRQECSPEIWNVLVHTGLGGYNTTQSTTNSRCFGGSAQANDYNKADANVGNTVVPLGLRVGNAVDGAVRVGSIRDASNNMLVVFHTVSATEGRFPDDGAVCWMYVSRLRQWFENY